MRTSRFVACWIGTGLAAAVGCSGPAERRYEVELERTPEPAAHAVHEERLRALMRDFERLRGERLPKPVDTRDDEARRALEVARLARALAESAARIPAAAPAALDARERHEFRALAEQLERLGRALAADAPRLASGPRQARLDEIDATCEQCHTRFRIPGIVQDTR
jgi:cytochrome c556